MDIYLLLLGVYVWAGWLTWRQAPRQAPAVQQEEPVTRLALTQCAERAGRVKLRTRLAQRQERHARLR